MAIGWYKAHEAKGFWPKIIRTIKIKGGPYSTRRKQASKYNRGRRAKSECNYLHYQKTKIQGVGRDHILNWNVGLS